VVDTLADDDLKNGNCTLREAIYAANNDAERDECMQGSGLDTIDLSGLSGTILLDGSELSITSDLAIKGLSADQLSIDANFRSRVFSIVYGVEVSISDVTITGGNGTTGQGGGGILNSGKLIVVRCAFNSNQTDGNGGGIYNSGTTEVNSSTFYNNLSHLNGGGIYNFEGTVEVNNCTFSQNKASYGGPLDNYGGGGICNMAEDGPASSTINNTTFSLNSAKWGGGVSNFEGSLTIRNTILSGNTVHSGGSGPNCSSSSAISSSYNLESGVDCGFTGTGDLQNAAAELDPLQNNGGPTSTHALQAESDAINAGSCTDTGGSPVTRDQRGFFRKSPCDIGAFEYFPPIYLPVVTRN
jgi:CSLREA domain-containing protein